jgi:hypothetical protein
MLNKRPIFIVGFDHGGTNILLNLLRSHPGVCSPRGELTEVFQGKGRWPKIREPLGVYLNKWRKYNLPVLLRQREFAFSKKLWQLRRPFGPQTAFHVDRVLYQDKLFARGETQNRYKAQNVEYSLDEIRASRLLSKNVAGVIFLTDELAKMYSDAIFIAIVRNGLALCEGHIRRGVKAEKIAARYQLGCQKMLSDAEKLSNYHIFRFEDILEHPGESLRDVYERADLDLSQVSKIRLETKRVIGKDGEHQFVHNTAAKQLVWYERDSFAQHFVSDVNQNQISRLTSDQHDEIVKIAGESLRQFSYLP